MLALARGALVVAVTLSASLAITTRAHADPQMSVGFMLGGGGANLTTRALPVFHMGLRADMLFGRKDDHDMAIGPYIDVTTIAFESLDIGGGVSWLLPISEHFPLVLSAGAHAHGVFDGGIWEPAMDAMIWAGSRSFNFNSIYGLTAGIFVQGRWGFGDGHQADILGGAQIDLELFVLPFVLLVNAFR